MTSQTKAIIIAVSSYLQKEIEPLPAAQIDAIHFSRAIRNWGVSEPNLFFFINKDAQEEMILSFFDGLLEKEKVDKWIFYFCGHGYRSHEDLPKSYLLLFDSIIKKDEVLHALNIDFLIEKLTRLSAQASYVFIDACNLRINRLIHPKLEEELKGDRVFTKSLFCLLSSGIQESFENEKENYGYFTRALLNGLSRIGKAKGSASQLLDDIHAEMTAQTLPFPEMYSIGNPHISFISSFLKSTNEIVYRQEFIGHIQDMLLQNRKKILCLLGGEGVGKSVVCQTLASERLKTVLITIPSPLPISYDVIEELGKELKKRENYPFSEFFSFQDIVQFSYQFPYYLVLIDQVEKLNPQQFNLLLEKLSKLKMEFLFSSRQSLKAIADKKFYHLLIDLEVPPFSFLETKDLVQFLKPDCTKDIYDLIFLCAQGNPLKIKKIALYSDVTLNKFEFQTNGFNICEKSLKEALAAIYACGLYINKDLLSRIFNLDMRHVSFLEEIGLVEETANGYVPNDFFYQIAESEELCIDERNTRDYWYEQMVEMPQHVYVAKHLIHCILCLGYEEKADQYLRIAFEALNLAKKEHIQTLLEGVEIFHSCSYMTETALFLAEILVERGLFDFAHQILVKPPISNALSYQAKCCEAQKLWRTGRLKESISLYAEMIKMTREDSEKAKHSFYCGIAFFLMGDWNQALLEFKTASQNSIEETITGRAQCMIGTIIGMQGTDIQSGRQFLENGIFTLEKLKDFSGLWSGYNNLGELLWKYGDYKSSLFFLEKALQLSNALEDESAIGESLRNLLQLYLKKTGPFSEETSNLLVRLETIDWKNLEFFEKKQFLNTLATAYIFRRNIPQALLLMRSILPLTIENEVFHIFSLSNLAFLARLLGMPEKEKKLFAKAIHLAEKNDHQLALHQIKSDYQICFGEKYG